MATPVKTTLTDASTRDVVSLLRDANAAFSRAFPGDPAGRQPVHTVYGGAHLFKADVARKLGARALDALDEYAPDFATFARALRLPGHETLPSEPGDIRAMSAALDAGDGARVANEAASRAHAIRARVVAKLQREPVEDLRIDFEDGFGVRPDAEEDDAAVHSAKEVARGLRQGSLPPFIGIRVKSLAEETRVRAVRTLDLFVTALVDETGGALPPSFVVTIPKVTVPEHVAATASLLRALEQGLGLGERALRLEPMIESTASIVDAQGRVNPARLLAAADGRCTAAHFGTYDYTASCNVTAAHQRMTHPACDLARGLLQIALARTGVLVSDGATNVMPVPIHRAAEGRPLGLTELAENRAAVHHAWALHFANIQDSLMRGIYQGWDLHPAQLPVRYAAVYAFFLSGLEAAADRLRHFVAKAAQASLLGDVFDDAATGQGLLNYFLQAIASGAITEDEALERTRLGLEDVRSRSFAKILTRRTGPTE